MVRCLVTGGAGFIGSHLTDGLLKKGDGVRVLDDFSTGKSENLKSSQNSIEVIRGSLTDRKLVDDAAKDCEVIYHLGALPSVARSVEEPRATHEVCVTGTLNVLEAARRCGVRRVVYAASSSAYGDTPGAVRTEDDPVAPLSPYAAAKLAGEHYCRCFTSVYGLETVRLRFFNIFGPRQDSSSPYSGVIALFISTMLRGNTPFIDGDGEQSRDFTYVGNAVQAVINSAYAPAAIGNVYNIGNGGSFSVLRLVAELNAILGTDIKPQHRDARAGDVRHSQADISRAQRDLGYEPSISFAEGLRKTVEYQRSLVIGH